jgi:DNA-directed RNA polymerase specialized sigma24 family protein
MGDFRRLQEAEIAQLGEDRLIEHAVRARAAGDREQELLALRVFAFGMQDALLAFVRNRLDSHGEAVIEEIAERALEDAIRSVQSLRGGSLGEARAFVFQIARFRVVDYHRSGAVRPSPLGGGEGELDAAELDSLRVEGEDDAVGSVLVLREAIAELRPDHRAVVEDCVLLGYSAREAAERVASRVEGESDDSMTEQNVHQICSRFRKELRARLEADPGGRVER